MAGGHPRFRHLSRSSPHRVSLLRNLVTELLEHESITTTYPKAKEAQRFAEKLITLAKRNTNAARNKAWGIVRVSILTSKLRLLELSAHNEQRPAEVMPKLFGTIRERYTERPGGYTRVLHLEPTKEDQAHSAILELVDGPKDMRFAMTARAIAREKEAGSRLRNKTQANLEKVTKFRPDGEAELEKLVEQMRLKKPSEKLRSKPLAKEQVYPRRDEPLYESVRFK